MCKTLPTSMMPVFFSVSHSKISMLVFFLMIRRPPRSTHCISSAASDVYKRQVSTQSTWGQQCKKIKKNKKKKRIIQVYYYQYFSLTHKQNSLPFFIYDQIT
eukprot:TRINITY_DN20026_c0_g1_i2.p5 TRINITY_DN20026_c0_g1~~TRINITY_DN20026_c0_g1_i2.p5  ORF type:complete len:102 (-),score=35.55 TRINITY_DN20026_c0_g1_i2:644-949(-)